MRSLMLGFCLCAFLTAGCHDDEVCNPGLELVDGVCIPPPPTVDAGVGTTDGDAAASRD